MQNHASFSIVAHSNWDNFLRLHPLAKEERRQVEDVIFYVKTSFVVFEVHIRNVHIVNI